MEDKTNTTKRMSLLERIKKNIAKKSVQQNDEVQSDVVAAAQLQNTDHGDEQAVYTSMPEYFHKPTDNPLYKLWKAWKRAEDPEADMQEWKQNKLLDIIFDDKEVENIPLDALELETEKQLALVKLLVKAQKQYLLQFPMDKEMEKPIDVMPMAAEMLQEADFEESEDTVAEEKTALCREMVPSFEAEKVSVDAEIIIHVSQNRMAAWGFVFPPSGAGKPLQRAQIELALVEYMVCAGIKSEALDYIIAEQPYFQFILIACGTPMIPGKDAVLEEKFERNPDRIFQIDESGNVDYRAQNSIQIVHEGDIICEVVPAVKGTNGINVLGTEIPAEGGKDIKLTTGKNTKLNEDKTQIIAGIDGHLHYSGEKFSIAPIYYVDGDVDFKTGNIDFLGDVHIKGNVREDFVIHATGTVTIEGLVEGAMIESDKDILITNGILGENKAVLKAGGIIRAEYIENCVLYAGQEVQASSIITSFVYCDDTIRVTAGRGTVIGGKLVAAKLIDARIIGCAAERNTILSVGELPFIKKQKEDFTASLEELEKEADEVGRTARFLTEAAGDDPEKLQKAADYRLRRSVLSMQIAHVQKQLQDLSHKDSYVKGGKITADTIYPVTEINMQGMTYIVKETRKGNVVHVEDDQIQMF